RTHPALPRFPYTTLFRSQRAGQCQEKARSDAWEVHRLQVNCESTASAGALPTGLAATGPERGNAVSSARFSGLAAERAEDTAFRSEEHTSELQSLAYLVC